MVDQFLSLVNFENYYWNAKTIAEMLTVVSTSFGNLQSVTVRWMGEAHTGLCVHIAHWLNVQADTLLCRAIACSVTHSLLTLKLKNASDLADISQYTQHLHMPDLITLTVHVCACVYDRQMDRDPVKFMSTKNRFLIFYQVFTSSTIHLLLEKEYLFWIFIGTVWETWGNWFLYPHSKLELHFDFKMFYLETPTSH